MTTDCTCPITATPAAKHAIERLRAEHGDIILHITGGCCDARTPLCLQSSELLLGPRDVLLGVVETVPVYEMPSTPDGCCSTCAYVLDVVAGVPVGFSIAPGEGMRFAIRATLERPSEPEAEAAPPVEARRESLEEACV